MNNVIVACRLPKGVVLKIYDDEEIAIRAEYAKAKHVDLSPLRVVSSISLNGATSHPNYHPKDNEILGRFGKTSVPSDFWEKWLKQNERSDLVLKNLVFAEPNEARASSRAAEFANVKTGFEGLDQNKLPVIGVEYEGAADKRRSSVV